MILISRIGRFAVAAVVASCIAVTPPASAQQTPTCDGLAATIIGTSGNDTINGTPGDDVIVGLGGRDRIFGGDGHDVICGGDGGDLLRGQRGRDRLFGDSGNDRIQGNNGPDHLQGGSGRDAIRGDRGNDQISGDNGSDAINAGPDRDECDLDRRDTFSACERGDVAGASGTGNGGFNLAVGQPFVVHKADNGPLSFYVAEIASFAERDDARHTVRVFDKDGAVLETFGRTGSQFVGELIVRGTPARVEVSAEGPWEVVIKKPELLQRHDRDVLGTGSSVYLLKRPLGPNVTGRFTLADNVSGNVILFTFKEGRFPDLRVNTIFPKAHGTNVFEGQERRGTYLVAVQVDEGDWEMVFSG